MDNNISNNTVDHIAQYVRERFSLFPIYNILPIKINLWFSVLKKETENKTIHNLTSYTDLDVLELKYVI